MEKETHPLLEALLDSSLISQTDRQSYSIKIINCYDYLQIYFYEGIKIKKDKNWCPMEEDKNRGVIDKELVELPPKKKPIENKYNEIRFDNAIRSKLSLERLIKANIRVFKTFITLTFANNVTSIKEANKKLNIWLTRIRKLKKDLKYICVPEYQKRGAVHYHLITNLDLNSNIITLQANKTCQYDVLYWNYGFSSVFNIKDINIVGYLSKYMTKNIDNRLFNRKRYFNSKNLRTPKIEYIDTSNNKTMAYIQSLLVDKDIRYSNTYHTKIDNCMVKFYELTSYNIYYVN